MCEKKLLIGWGHQDITPNLPVMLRGQFNVRLAHEVLDPVTVTALAIETEDGASQSVMVSLDLVSVSDFIRDEVRKSIAEECRDLNPDSIFLSATHTHTSMTTAAGPGEPVCCWPDVEGYDRDTITRFIINRTVDAIKQAWTTRELGAISFGITTAVVGSNRRVQYNDGSAQMYGDTSLEEFTNIEGDCDHSVNFLFTYDQAHELTGMLINLPCPSQATEGISKISADFWHDARCAIKERHGENIHILPQCSAAGDQSPHVLITPSCQRRMLTLKYGTDMPMSMEMLWRKEIANRIANAVDEALPIASKDIRDVAILKHERAQVRLPRWKLTEEHVELAKKELDNWQQQLDTLEANLLDHDYSVAYMKVSYFRRIIERYEQQANTDEFLTEISITRIADIAFATNAFELLLDFGQRIKTRSRALQTFLVQLAGEGSYLAPHRSCAQGYGATPMDGEVGPEGGNALVEQTVEHINAMFDENLNPGTRF